MLSVPELQDLLKNRGWYLNMVTRYKTRYAYAKRRRGKTVITRYLKSESLFGELTPEEVLKRIS